MLDKIISIIKEELDTENIELTKDTKIVEDLGADSLDTIELITIIQEEYGIEFNDKEIKNIKTIGDIEESIKEKINE